MREYTLELPIIHSLPINVYDSNITRDMVVDRVWFGYKSYGDVGSDVYVDTRDFGYYYTIYRLSLLF